MTSELTDSIRDNLISRGRAIGLPLDFKLCLKSYSKKYNGRYSSKTNTVTLYLFSDPQETILVPFDCLFKIFIHEAVHSLQWHSSKFVRVKGVMHNAEFFVLFHCYMQIATCLGVIDTYNITVKEPVERRNICGTGRRLQSVRVAY